MVQIGQVCFRLFLTWTLEADIFQGLLDLKKKQDLSGRSEDAYIRYAEELPLSSFSTHDDVDRYIDEAHAASHALDTVRIVVCMTPSQSRRLANAQHVQSDIGFKRVTNYLEFELGGFDRVSGSGTIAF